MGVHDNFFSLGGHSLLATQLACQLQAYFYVTVPLAKIFANPTLADLIDVLAKLHGKRETVETIAETWQGVIIKNPAASGGELYPKRLN